MKNYVYSLFGADGDLLYVGATVDAKERLKQHARLKEWWGEVTDTVVEEYDDPYEASERESSLIRDKAPRYNRPPGGYWGTQQLYSTRQFAEKVGVSPHRVR